MAKLRAKDYTVKAEFHAEKVAMIKGTAKDHRRILESFDILGAGSKLISISRFKVWGDPDCCREARQFPLQGLKTGPNHKK